MRLARRLIFVLVVVAVSLWLWSVLFPGPERAIRRLLARTARAVSFTGNEGPMDQLRQLGEFANCFSPEVEVKFDAPGVGSQSIAGREELLSAAGAARSKGTPLKVDFLDASLVLAPDRESATVDLTVRAGIPGDRDFIVQEMKFYLKKFGRAWLIIRAETVKTLSTAQPFANALPNS